MNYRSSSRGVCDGGSQSQLATSPVAAVTSQFVLSWSASASGGDDRPHHTHTCMSCSRIKLNCVCRCLYELVVDSAYQRLGLASHLVKLMEAMVCFASEALFPSNSVQPIITVACHDQERNEFFFLLFLIRLADCTRAAPCMPVLITSVHAIVNHPSINLELCVAELNYCV